MTADARKAFHVIGVAPIRATGPCFGTPIFSSSSDSGLLYQMFREERIDGFGDVDLSMLDGVRFVEGDWSRMLGDPPLYAYVTEQGIIHIGEKFALRYVLLQEFEAQETRPHLRLMLATFLENEALTEFARAKLRLAEALDEPRVEFASQPDREVIASDDDSAPVEAEKLKHRLLAALAIGNPSIASLSYLLRCDVRNVVGSHDDMLLRALRDPSLSHFARSIVVVRLATVYQQDLPSLLSRLLEFVETAQQRPINLFVGTTLSDAVLQAFVVVSPSFADDVVGSIADELRRRNMEMDGDRHRLHVVARDVGGPAVQLVLSCRGATEGRSIPVVFKLHTALSDMWEEVASGERDDWNLGKSWDESVDTRFAHFKGFKLQLSDFTNAVEKTVRRLSEAHKIDAGLRGIPAIDITRLHEVGLSGDIQVELNDVAKDLLVAYGARYVREAAQPARLVNAAAILMRCLEKHEQRRHGDDQSDAAIEYAIRLESAVCLHWAAVLEAGEIRSEDLGYPMVRTNSNDDALKLLFGLARDKRYWGDAVVKFRIAEALACRGHDELALIAYRDAYASLQTDLRLPPRDFMRVHIPRMLALTLYHRAEALRRSSEAVGDRDMSPRQRQQYLLESLEATLSTYGQLLSHWPLDFNTRQHIDEDNVTANNILAYGVCYLNAGGDWADAIRVGFTRASMDHLLSQILGDGVDKVTRIAVADTIRAVGRFQGNRGLAEAAARRVLDLIAAEGPKELPLPYREALADASTELGRDASAGARLR